MPSLTRVPTTGLRQLAGVAAPPAYWYERGLLWVFVNGQLPPFASPAGAVDYNSISNYLATDPNRLPAVKYQHALVSAADAPMSYFNNGEGAGGLGTVWVRRPMVPYAWTLIGDLFTAANLELRQPPPATTSIIPFGLSHVGAASATGPVTVAPNYLLLSPVPFDGSLTFFSRLANLFR